MQGASASQYDRFQNDTQAKFLPLSEIVYQMLEDKKSITLK